MFDSRLWSVVGWAEPTPEWQLLARSRLLKRTRGRPQSDREPDVLRLGLEPAAGRCGRSRRRDSDCGAGGLCGVDTVARPWTPARHHPA
jgi:hypothetical protein